MSVWDKYECEGQLSLFDFLEEPKQENNVDRQRKIEQEVIDNVLNWTIRCCPGWSKLTREERIQQAKEKNMHSCGGIYEYGWQCSSSGIDIEFDRFIGKVSKVHIGWPMFDDRVFGRECKFSGHTCNREELWKVAEGLDNIKCKKVCCRKCKVKCCGARCNGSEEPKEAERIEVNVRGLLDDGYCPVCNLQLDDLAEQCPECGALLSWNDWRRINAEYIESR